MITLTLRSKEQLLIVYNLISEQSRRIASGAFAPNGDFLDLRDRVEAALNPAAPAQPVEPGRPKR